MDAEAWNPLDEEREEFPWPLFISLACSLLIVVGGMFWTYRIWRDTNLKYHELFHVRETVQGLHSTLGIPEARLQ